jgi:hypothetical protein
VLLPELHHSDSKITSDVVSLMSSSGAASASNDVYRIRRVAASYLFRLILSAAMTSHIVIYMGIHRLLALYSSSLMSSSSTIFASDDVCSRSPTNFSIQPDAELGLTR